MRVHILESAVGDGFPQWNCNTGNNRGFFEGTTDVQTRTQSSITASADGQHRALINVLPNMRQQAIVSEGLHTFADAEMQEEVWPFFWLVDERGWIEMG